MRDNMTTKFLIALKTFIPKKLFSILQPTYHWILSMVGVFVYWHPSRSIKIVGVTGTKGKSTVTEMINAILEEHGLKTALSNTIRFKIGGESERNMHKMTMPGRFFVQRFLRRAVEAKCDWVIFEMTSEGVKQFRHKKVLLDALVFTNLSPEHVESHGSFEKYRDAKRSLGTLLEKSTKNNRVLVANADDPESSWYLDLGIPTRMPFSLQDAQLFTKTQDGYNITFRNTPIHLQLPGEFNIYNTLAAATFAISQDISRETIKHALEKFSGVHGRVEFVQKNPFAIVVDYAHTTDSLRKFYTIFEGSRNICVLGNTGGGRDTWKRPEMAAVAEKHCEHVILTDEDPYDESPEKILREMLGGIKNKKKIKIVMNRRKAIAAALALAQKTALSKNTHVNVLITGKGTDPYIMRAGGVKTPWDDKTVVIEELKKLKKDNKKKK